ncbi:MAG: hypothetical protein PHW00_02570 [Clostridia bacterium]|nr:hypothetical protein [Clostridia bacterium]
MANRYEFTYVILPLLTTDDNCVVDGVDIVLNGYCSACTAKKNN